MEWCMPFTSNATLIPPEDDGAVVDFQLVYDDAAKTEYDKEFDLFVTSDRKWAFESVVGLFPDNHPIQVDLFKDLSDIEALEELEKLAFNAE